ncbi:hypothetical protein G6F57_009392 [Rhizopus arrhizus]|uniref:GRIP domain-containing protein n=1 Tax=Rhizopus oryzae TaxID=64495 RepID=A0A9P7BS41_RHIOR|nr:hypothetical protein G6F23_008160 [Rhizopus arrhizus]KAG0758946.1 hypothetical protein G6F24_009432 [Rhizopus arrhizus]KAG0776621.1 hypothetical protein G6F22_012443 [Rhizopus arrhizus]KAG0785231.1 hypothetical protein G6F21_009396 [Rhizopus arrhizus]KAG0806293.1 hypothetical protein G6F20_011239 [Rhizopus arrhizus]
MARKQTNNQKRNLQEQIKKLKNEIEELKLEREENKKSVIHFMQEVEMAQDELKRAQEVISQLTSQKSENTRLEACQECCHAAHTGLENERSRADGFEGLYKSTEHEKLALQNEFLKENYESTQQVIHHLNHRLDQASLSSRQWQEKYDDLYTLHMGLEIQIKEIEQAKTREIQLRSLNKVLRNEIRKMKQAQDESLNIEYLRNVIIKFLEKKTTRPQLVPILSALLQCTHEDKTKLHQIVQNSITV